MSTPKVSKSPDVNWGNDSIQFPRLIAELQAIGGFTENIISEIATEMDLDEELVCDLIDRACDKWDEIKQNILTSTK